MYLEDLEFQPGHDILTDTFEITKEVNIDLAWKLSQCYKAYEDSWLMQVSEDFAGSMTRLAAFRSFGEGTAPFPSGGDDPWVRTALDYFEDINGICAVSGRVLLEEEREKTSGLDSKIKAWFLYVPKQIRKSLYTLFFIRPLIKRTNVNWDYRSEKDILELLSCIVVASLLRDTTKGY